MSIVDVFGTRLRFYRPEEIQKLSVVEIRTPHTFDNLGRPSMNGLHDPAMGPIDRYSSCLTCSQTELSCPGHLGSYRLFRECYQPLLITELMKLLNATCLMCSRFRLTKFERFVWTNQFKLVFAGLVRDAADFMVSPMSFYAKHKLSTEPALGSILIDHESSEDAERDDDDDDDEDNNGGDDEKKKKKKSKKKSVKVRRDVKTSLSVEDMRIIQVVLDRVVKQKGKPNYDINKDAVSQYERFRMVRQFFETCSKHKHCEECGSEKITIRNHQKTLLYIKKKIFSITNGATSQFFSFFNDYLKEVRSSQKEAMDNEEEEEENNMNDDRKETNSDEEGENVETNGGEIVEAKKQSKQKKYALKKREKTESDIIEVFPWEVSAFIDELWKKETDIVNYLYSSHGYTKSGDHSNQSILHNLADPNMFFLSVLAILPSKFRPIVFYGGGDAYESRMNSNLKVVMKANTILQKFLHGTEAEKTKIRNVVTFKDVVIDLQSAINAYVLGGTVDGRYIPGIANTLEKKEGLFRMNMMGKRVNNAGRSVILPDPYIGNDEVAIPKYFAMNVCYPVPVSHFNLEEVKQFVRNGSIKYPGANYIEEISTGRMTSLSVFNSKKTGEGDLEALSNTLKPGVHKVHRHILDGDVVLMNRQPTLHRPSIMAHRVVVNDNQKTIRLHYINCKSYNADFDGDEMNVHFLQNDLARSEAYNIMKASSQYISPTSGAPLRGLIQDFIVSGVLLTQKDTFLTREEYQHFVYNAIHPVLSRIKTFRNTSVESQGKMKLLYQEDELQMMSQIYCPVPCILKPQPLWSGKQVITSILNILLAGKVPLNLTGSTKIKPHLWLDHSEESQVVIYDNQLLTGIIDKNQIGDSQYGLVHAVFECYGPEIARDLLSCFSRLFINFLQYHGFTCGLDDCLLRTDADERRDEIIKEANLLCQEASYQFSGTNSIDDVTQYKHAMAEKLFGNDPNRKTNSRRLDSSVKVVLNKKTSELIENSIPTGQVKKFPRNFLTLMTESGAKGSLVNASQISCCLGLQEMEGARVQMNIGGKTLPCFDIYDPSAEAGGYVASRFLSGMNPKEYFFHTMAGREGLVDTAVKTSRSGYLQRSLIKHLEDLVVQYDSTVRNSAGNVVQFHYGGDGLETTKSSFRNQFKFIAMNQTAFAHKFRISEMVKHFQVDGYCHPKVKKYYENGDLDKKDPILHVLDPRHCIGSISDVYHKQIEQYVEQNPDDIIATDFNTHQMKTISASRFRAVSYLKFMKSLAEPGEAVGLLAGQGIGEPSTQMTLNTFHFAGLDVAHVTVGIPRLRELLMTGHTRQPMMILPLKDCHQEEQTTLDDDQGVRFAASLSKITFFDVLQNVSITEKYESIGSVTHVKHDILLKFDVKLLQNYYSFPVKSMFEKIVDASFIYPLCCMIKRNRKASTSDRMSYLHDKILRDKLNEGDQEMEDEDQQTLKEKGNDKDDEDNDEDDNNNNNEDEGNVIDEDGYEAEKSSRKKKELSSYDDDDEDGDNDEDEEEEEEQDDDDDDDNDKNAGHEKNKDVEEDSEEVGDESSEKKPKKKTKKGKSNKIDDLQVEFSFLTSRTVNSQTGYVQLSIIRPMLNKAPIFYYSLIEKVAKENSLAYIEGIQKATYLSKTREITIEGENYSKLFELKKTHELIDMDKIKTNNVEQVICKYGIEAGRQLIVNEVRSVFDGYGITVDERHIQLIADYMTASGDYKPCNRHSLNGRPSPFHKMSFESPVTFLKQALLGAEADSMENPSSRLMLGQVVRVGTGMMDLMTPVNA